MHDQPNGNCECGCGRRTPLARQTNTGRGWVKGQPIRFIKGHSGHKYRSGDRLIEQRWSIEDRGHATPCWIWLLHKDQTGYGKLMAGGSNRYAHRFYYERQYGPLPQHVHLDHLCRNRSCVNPEHLEPVSNAENSRRGANAKLSPEQVSEIRLLLAYGWFGSDIGPAYGVSAVQVSNIKNGKSWA